MIYAYGSERVKVSGRGSYIYAILRKFIETADRSLKERRKKKKKKKRHHIASIDSLVLARVRSPGSLVVDAAL